LAALDKEAALRKISDAKQELGDAEKNLEKALLDLKVSVRAEKAMIGKALEEAFGKVKHASKNLVDLEKLIVGG
jgi:ribosomal protein L23